MTPDTKRQLQATGATVALIVAAFTGGVYFAENQIAAVASPKKITLLWENATNKLPGTVTEVWASPDLLNWILRTNVTGTNVTLPADLPREFFKIRHRLGTGTNAIYSDWSRRPTL